MNLDVSVVTDEAELSKLAHEMADSGSGGADHLHQRFLTDMRIDRLRAAFRAEIRKQQKQPREPPAAVIAQWADRTDGVVLTIGYEAWPKTCFNSSART
jgi:hypothetical protein